MLTGLDWSAIAVRLDALVGVVGGPADETRARVIDLLEGIESGAVAAAARRASDSDV